MDDMAHYQVSEHRLEMVQEYLLRGALVTSAVSILGLAVGGFLALYHPKLDDLAENLVAGGFTTLGGAYATLIFSVPLFDHLCSRQTSCSLEGRIDP